MCGTDSYVDKSRYRLKTVGASPDLGCVQSTPFRVLHTIPPPAWQNHSFVSELGGEYSGAGNVDWSTKFTLRLRGKEHG